VGAEGLEPPTFALYGRAEHAGKTCRKYLDPELAEVQPRFTFFSGDPP